MFLKRKEDLREINEQRIRRINEIWKYNRDSMGFTRLEY